MVEQGTSFTFMHSKGPMEVNDPETYQARNAMLSASRVWLGWTGGTDWLHDAVARDFGPTATWYTVESERRTAHVGAAGEVAVVVLILMGVDMLRAFTRSFAERMGQGTADAVLDWAREQARDRRRTAGLEQTDGPPNFFDWESDDLARGMLSEVADVVGAEAVDLEIVSANREEGFALIAVYRDASTGRQSEVQVQRDAAAFRELPSP